MQTGRGNYNNTVNIQSIYSLIKKARWNMDVLGNNREMHPIQMQFSISDITLWKTPQLAAIA